MNRLNAPTRWVRQARLGNQADKLAKNSGSRSKVSASSRRPGVKCIVLIRTFGMRSRQRARCKRHAVQVLDKLDLTNAQNG